MPHITFHQSSVAFVEVEGSGLEKRLQDGQIRAVGNLTTVRSDRG